MFPSTRRRPGTTPSFWRAYHKAQLGVVASSTHMRSSGVVKARTTRQLITANERTKKPAPPHFVCIGP